MTNDRARGWVIVAATVLLALPGGALAESPPAQCVSDADCDGGGQCDIRLSCTPPELTCVTSADCPESYVCGYSSWNCPAEDPETVCPTGTRGRCVAPLEHPCSMDAECAGDELCYASARPTCAEGDGACDERPPGHCVDWSLVCGASTSCAADYECVEGRCVSEGADDEAGEIVIDQDKTDALHAEWARGRPGGCAVTRGASGSVGWAFVALALFVLTRRRHVRAG